MNNFAQVVILAASLGTSAAALGETRQYPITLELEPNEDHDQVALCWSAVEGTFLGAAALFVISETEGKGTMYPSIEHISEPFVLAEKDLSAGMFLFFVQDPANSPGQDLSQRVRIPLSKGSVVTIKQGCAQEAGSAALVSNETNTGDVYYRGVKSCGKIEVEVTFSYDPEKRQIRDFESLNRCIDGGARSLWEPDVVIDVKSDNSFYYETPSSTWVRGRFGNEGVITGTFDESSMGLHCDDGKLYPECTEWVASPDTSNLYR